MESTNSLPSCEYLFTLAGSLAALESRALSFCFASFLRISISVSIFFISSAAALNHSFSLFTACLNSCCFSAMVFFFDHPSISGKASFVFSNIIQVLVAHLMLSISFLICSTLQTTRFQADSSVFNAFNLSVSALIHLLSILNQFHEKISFHLWIILPSA
jgi:hypothetical protein